MAAKTVRRQVGTRLNQQVYDNNPLLPQLTRGAKVTKPQTVWQVHWQDGPVLAPWPTEDVLSTISDRISDRVSAVCLLEWGEDATSVRGSERRAAPICSPANLHLERTICFLLW